MNPATFPEFITRLPQADIPFPGVKGWLSQGPDHQVVLFDIDPIGVVPRHSHGDQWGVVFVGELQLTIDGTTRTYRAGDSYFIPAGVVHTATFNTRVRAIDIFADADRYRAIVPGEPPVAGPGQDRGAQST